MSNYKSSIIFNYGDTDKLRADIATLLEILDRQGATLLIDAIAEYSARSMQKFNFSYLDKSNLRVSLVNQLNEALIERT